MSNKEKLRASADKLIKLLGEDEAGCDTWHQAVHNTCDEIAEFAPSYIIRSSGPSKAAMVIALMEANAPDGDEAHKIATTCEPETRKYPCDDCLYKPRGSKFACFSCPDRFKTPSPAATPAKTCETCHQVICESGRNGLCRLWLGPAPKIEGIKPINPNPSPAAGVGRPILRRESAEPVQIPVADCEPIIDTIAREAAAARVIAAATEWARYDPEGPVWRASVMALLAAVRAYKKEVKT